MKDLLALFLAGVIFLLYGSALNAEQLSADKFLEEIKLVENDIATVDITVSFHDYLRTNSSGEVIDYRRREDIHYTYDDAGNVRVEYKEHELDELGGVRASRPTILKMYDGEKSTLGYDNDTVYRVHIKNEDIVGPLRKPTMYRNALGRNVSDLISDAMASGAQPVIESTPDEKIFVKIADGLGGSIELLFSVHRDLFLESYREYDSLYRLVREFRSEPFETQAGILLPGNVVKTVYSYDAQGKAVIDAESRMQVHEATINADLPSETFVFPIPNGALVVDERDVDSSETFHNSAAMERIQLEAIAAAMESLEFEEEDLPSYAVAEDSQAKNGDDEDTAASAPDSNTPYTWIVLTAVFSLCIVAIIWIYTVRSARGAPGEPD